MPIPLMRKQMDASDAVPLLEIWVNGTTHHVIASINENDEFLWAHAEDLTASGIKIDPAETGADGLVDIQSLPGIHAVISDHEQKLYLTTDAARLLPQAFDLRPLRNVPATQRNTGFIGSYDLVGTTDNFSHFGATSNGGATVGGAIFTPQGTFNSNGFTQTQNGAAHVTRLDSAAQMDDPDTLQRWQFGDAISGSLYGSRSVRFGGAQMATDFSLQPDLNTMPLPAFFGQSAIPATVDVFVNAARVFETNIDSGPFQINNLPIVTGNGQASVVVRDVLGQETVATLPFFGSNALLRQGLSSYDIDAGFLRNDYGQQSFAYGAPLAAGTYSKGVTDALTLETHGEFMRDLQLGEAGAAFSVGSYGVVQAAAALSENTSSGAQQSGALYALSMESQLPPLGFFASASQIAGAYRDAASTGGTPPPRFQAQIGANVNLADKGALAASWIDMKDDGEPSSRLLSASYTLSFAQRWNIGVTSFYDYGNRALVSEAVLTLSLGDGKLADSTTRIAHHSNEQEWDYGQSVNPDGGFGYRLSDSMGADTIHQGEATWVGSRGSLDAALSSTDGDQAGRIAASGGIVVMDGSLYATHHPDDSSVVLVHTGQPDAHIYEENRLVATADEDGDALLTGFTPFVPSHIAIDPLDYHLSSMFDTTDKTVIPDRQSGVVVDLTPTTQKPVLAILHLADGRFPPLGSSVTLDGDATLLVVGYHGELFIPDLRQTATGHVTYPAGSCPFIITVPPARADMGIPRIDPVPCVARASP